MAANGFALKFTESSLDRVDFGANALGSSIKDLSAFTLEAWIKVGSNANEANARAYLERQGGSGKYPRLALSAWNNVSKGVGRLRFEFGRVDGKADTNYYYTLGDLWDDYWHHVAFTVDIGDKEYKIYLDGALVARGNVPDGGEDGEGNALKVSNTAPAGILLGAGYDGTTYHYWDGKIDCLRIWNSVRSQNAIQTEMNDHLANPGGESNLIEEWRLNEGTGTSTAGAKNATWTATLKRNGANSSALWTIDRPFMGDGEQDEVPPANFTMNAPTNITADGFELNWASTTDNVYVQYYEVTVATDNAFNNPVAGFSALNVGLATTIVVTGLTPATNYFARVRAFDAALNASDYATYNNNAAIVTLAQGDVVPPTAPVATSATNVNDTSFVANWTAATDNVGVAGYKIDVGLNANFTSFLAGYRNLDVGNVLTHPITVGVQPNTTYYYRVRAYDAAENESVESNTIVLTTADPPDTTPPDTVVLAPATSVASTSFTANWNVGVDNVAVAGYLLDVATDETFTTYVSGFQNRDVGNVTSFGVTNLAPMTGYAYRVRAYDAAGNISDDTTEPELVTTTPSTVDEGGLLHTTFDPTDDTWVNQASVNTNYGDSANAQVVGTEGSVRRAYLKFDLTELVGTLVNAELNLSVTNSTVSPISIKKVISGTWDEDTLTYATDTLVLSETEVTFLPNTVGWWAVDVASLLDAGFTEYTLAITMPTGTDTFTFETKESANIPTLVVETDPTSTTEVQTLALAANNLNLTNLFKNPSAEIGGPSFGGATGIAAVGSLISLSQDSTYAYDGIYSAKFVTAVGAGNGVKFESPTGLGIVGQGQTFKMAVHVRSNSPHNMWVKPRLIYTDATTTDGLDVAIFTNTDWRRFECSVTSLNAKTIDKVELWVYQTAADTTSKTLWADAAVAIQTSGVVAAFNGSTSPDTDWDGTAHASPSTFEAVTLAATATYVGDGDGDNAVAVAYKRAGEETEWITNDLLVASINRGTKQVTATVGPIYRGNEIFNPSFTVSADHWTASASGTTLTRITDDGMEEAGASDLACLEVVGDGAVINQGAEIAQLVRAVQNEQWAFSLGAKSLSGTTSLQLQIQQKNSAGTVLSTDSFPITITPEWARYGFVGFVSNADTAFVSARIVNTAATAAAYRIDQAQLERSSAVTTYVDGDMDDGEWEGTPYASASYRVLRHEARYDVRFTFTDADGVMGPNPISTEITTQAVPDDPLTVGTLTLTPSNTSILVIATYTGDDNESATAMVEWKRTDLATWSKVVHTWDRNDKLLAATISNLKPGTIYDVRVTFADLDDTVYGANPLQASTTTTITGLSAEAQTRITFGGFVLMGDETHYVGVTEHDAFSLPERRTQVEVLPRMDGGVELSDFWGTRTIRMRGFITGESRADLNEKVREFRKALAPRQQRLVIDTLDSQNYYFNATCTSLGIQEVGGETIRHVLWDAEFTCADPFRYESAETIESNITLNDGETVAITNSGDLRIDPVLTVTTASATPISLTIVNMTTGERIRPSSTIVAGDKLVIDASKLSLTKNGVEIDYEGAFPTLAVGQNTLRADLSTGSIRVTIRRRHRFF